MKIAAKSPLPLLTILGATLFPSAAVCEPAVDLPLSYELTVDGHTFDMVDSTPADLDFGGGQRSRVTVKVKDTQHYTAGKFAFDYERHFALKDDHDMSSRTVTLIRADGASIVITDQNKPDGKEGKALSEYLQSSMEDRYRAGVVKKLVKTPAESVHFKGKAGHLTTIVYIDEDDAERLCKLYVVQDDAGRFSIIVQGSKSAEKEIDRIAGITLNSIGSVR